MRADKETRQHVGLDPSLSAIANECLARQKQGWARNFQKPEFEIGNHGVEVLDGIEGERQFR
jgi:hypothetical protein